MSLIIALCFQLWAVVRTAFVSSLTEINTTIKFVLLRTQRFKFFFSVPKNSTLNNSSIFKTFRQNVCTIIAELFGLFLQISANFV